MGEETFGRDAEYAAIAEFRPRVLVAAPAETEAQLSFAMLGDLLAGRISVRLRLSRSARRRLRHARRVRLALTVTLRDPAATLRATITAHR